MGFGAWKKFKAAQSWMKEAVQGWICEGFDFESVEMSEWKFNKAGKNKKGIKHVGMN